MGIAYRVGMIVVIMLLALYLPNPAFAVTKFNVSIDTSAISELSGQIAFDLTNKNGAFNHAEIILFSTDGTLGLPETQGGLVEGDLILLANPAFFTRIGSQFFFNELVVTFVKFGKKTVFTVQLPEGPSPAGNLPDEFALFALNATGFPLLNTTDPLGANALFTVDVTGTPNGQLRVFSPATFVAPDSIEIKLVINRPPDIRQAHPSVTTLWPPNHQMATVSILGVTDPDGDPIAIRIDRIMQDEPTNGLGDGDTCPDGLGLGTSTAQLRAERSGTGNGRVYTIFFTALDGRGGSSPGGVKVSVPHDRNDVAVDDGPRFDSTVCRP